MKTISKLQTTKETECSCPSCQAMCKRPCWGTPEDIKRIIEAGFGDRLMKDGWFGDSTEPIYAHDGTDDIPILCGALKGSEGKRAPFIPSSQEGCTFFKKGRCELHSLGLKPSEGRLSYHEGNEESETTLHKEIALLWKSPEARFLVKDWCEKYGVNPQERHSALEVMLGGLQMMLMGIE